MFEPEKKYRVVVSEVKRLSKACLECNKRKTKCSGSWPCVYCTKQGRNCTFPVQSKRGPKRTRVANTDDTLFTNTIIVPPPTSPSLSLTTAESILLGGIELSYDHTTDNNSNNDKNNNNLKEQKEISLTKEQGIYMDHERSLAVDQYFFFQATGPVFKINEIRIASTPAFKAQLYSILAFISRHNQNALLASEYLKEAQTQLKEVWDTITMDVSCACIVVGSFYPYASPKSAIYFSHAATIAKFAPVRSTRDARVKYCAAFCASNYESSGAKEKSMEVLQLSDKAPFELNAFDKVRVLALKAHAMVNMKINLKDPIEFMITIDTVYFSKDEADVFLSVFLEAEITIENNRELFGTAWPIIFTVFKVLVLWKSGDIEKATVEAASALSFFENPFSKLILYNETPFILILFAFFQRNECHSQANTIKEIINDVCLATNQIPYVVSS